MTAMNRQQTLINALTEKQIITAEQVETALAWQKEHAATFEQALVSLGLLSLDDLGVVYDDVFQVRTLKLEDVEIDREAVRHVPAAVARRFHLIPVRRSGNTLAVAMTDPSQPEALAALRSVTDFDIIPFVARYDAIEHALYIHYGDSAPETDDDADKGDTLVRPRALLDEDRAMHVGKSIQLNRNQTFESFVADTGNDFPLSIARAICEQLGEDSHNPFHCWGPSGSGKTHLLNAIANHVTAHAPLKRFVLTTGQRFVDDLFQSIRDHKLNFFRYLYRELDLLLIDDAEALLYREWAQKELAETFRHLRAKGRRLVIAAPRNLATEARVLPDLRLELESGVIAGFGRYSEMGRIEIARRYAGATRISPEALSRAVQVAGNNLYELLMLLQHMAITAANGEGELTADLAEDLIRLYSAAATDGAPVHPAAPAVTVSAASVRSL